MPEILDSVLYNIGLAFFSTRNEKNLDATDIMDSETENDFEEICDKDKSFEKRIKEAVQKCSSEYSDAVKLQPSDFQSEEDFFAAKNDAEDKVVSKLRNKLSL